jgi:hypothetical protein
LATGGKVVEFYKIGLDLKNILIYTVEGIFTNAVWLEKGELCVKTCPNCGKALGDNMRFCVGCGQNLSGDTDWVIGASAPEPVREAKPFVPPRVKRTPAPQSAASVGVSRLVSVLLAVLLVLTAVISVVRGTLYKAVVSLDAEKLIEALIDEHFDEDNLFYYQISSALRYATGSDLEEAAELFNKPDVKKAVQEVVNSLADTIITADFNYLIDEDDIEDYLRAVASEVEDVTGYDMSSSDIRQLASYIDDMTNDILEEELGVSGRRSRLLEDFWEDEIPGELSWIRILLFPATSTLLFILCVLGFLALVALNLRNLKRLFSLAGVPLLIMGIIGLLLAVLTGVWVNLMAEASYLSDELVSLLLSGYRTTAISFAAWGLILGIGCLVVRGTLFKEAE